MPTPDPDQLRAIKTFPSLVKYLRDELGWPIDAESVDDLTFEYSPEELGLDAKHAARIREIKQLRPLETNQPWGIFWVSFEKKKLPMVVMRRILGNLITKKPRQRQQSHPPHVAVARSPVLFLLRRGRASQHFFRPLTMTFLAIRPFVG